MYNKRHISSAPGHICSPCIASYTCNVTVLDTIHWLQEDWSTMAAIYLDVSNPNHQVMVGDDMAVWQHPSYAPL